jgi:hypothetical protein
MKEVTPREIIWEGRGRDMIKTNRPRGLVRNDLKNWMD